LLQLIPKNKFFPMPDLLDAVQARGEAVHVFPMWEKWIDAGSPEEFQQVLIEFATGVEE
jgi:NDP-sugar pyrophosphorylase family protein